MTKFLRLPQVLERTGLTRSTLYSMMDRGEFIRPVKISPRLNGWPESDVDRFMAARIEARVA